MALATYSDLKTSLADWLNRSDLTAVIPDFIALAEGVMSAQLDARPMESQATLTCVAANAYLALPSDMLEMRRLMVTSTTPQYVLKFMTPDALAGKYAYGYSSIPQSFTVIGSQIQLAPIPDSAYSLELTYQQRIPALSVSNTTNWLLTNFPNVYLYASLLQASPYLGNDARIAVWQRMFDDGVAAVNSIDWYSGSTMTVRAS
jgi:hypothetical protein